MSDPKLRVVQDDERAPVKQPTPTDDFFYSMLKEPSPVRPHSETKRVEGWHQPKSPPSQTQLHQAQAQQTYIMEHERTAQLHERRGFFSGLLIGSRQSFLVTVMIGGFSLFIWKIYQAERRMQ